MKTDEKHWTINIFGFRNRLHGMVKISVATSKSNLMGTTLLNFLHDAINLR